MATARAESLLDSEGEGSVRNNDEEAGLVYATLLYSVLTTFACDDMATFDFVNSAQ